MIEERIKRLLELKTERPILLVTKGFSKKDFSTEEHLFSKYSAVFVDDFHSKIKKPELLMHLMMTGNSINSPFYWVTIEEYIFISSVASAILPDLFEVFLLINNLYHRQFPYQGTLSDVSKYYHLFYKDGEEEISDKDQFLHQELSNYYGDITYSTVTDSYYVTYAQVELDSEHCINLYDYSSLVKQDVNQEEQIVSIELSEDDITFNDFIVSAGRQALTGRIDFVYSGSLELLPNNYYYRLAILQRKFPNLIINLASKSSMQREVEREGEYSKILEHYWGYQSFRLLKMYKDPDNFGKETIEVSQAQIIDDIIQQTERAYRQESYRDIYITSSTGSGKSIMFQIPALYLAEQNLSNPPLTIIISPLIGLMNDQVDSMIQRGIKTARAIHSNTPPYERERTLDEISNYQVDMLYLSPETLQGRSNIRDLIGERQLGLVIIDEAHIVTTWGKTFRADYWYLGIYLQRLRKEYNFPIVTFTATAVYGGKEDMYLDTRDSLNMINPIVYLGYIKRDDIIMHIDSSDKQFSEQGNDYRKTKNYLAAYRLRNAMVRNEKSLVYFPTVKLLHQFDTYLKENYPEIHGLTGKFHGQLIKEEKDEVLRGFKEGELRFVLATKAFGMGIDIPDITHVYHYAPTGSVTDYIQEIGRVARDKALVRNGFGHAWFDFLKNDFVEVNKLHGMGAIRKHQIIEVIKKILAVYKENGNRRNLLLSSDDFGYIFEEESDNLDNKIKTILLMIEKDYSAPSKLGYPPFVARPRTLFGDDIIFGSARLEKSLKASRLASFFEKQHPIIGSQEYSSVYSIDLSGIWKTFYKTVSFADFKRRLYKREQSFFGVDQFLVQDLNFTTGLAVPAKSEIDIGILLQDYQRVISSFERFAENVKRKNYFFTISELGQYLQRDLNIKENLKARMVAQTLINSSFEFEKIMNTYFIKDFVSSKGTKYRFTNNPDVYFSFMKQHLRQFYLRKERSYQTDKVRINYHYRLSKDIEKDKLVLGVAEALDLLTYEVKGGGKPQIFIRINSIYPLERAVKNEGLYRNHLLSSIMRKHWLNVEFLTYLFKHQVNAEKESQRLIEYTKFFWEAVEDYFLGQIPEVVENNLYKRRGKDDSN